MSYDVKILADSINEQGNRLITFQATYPRIIHSEALTHRMFSRNAQSSRAMPVSKMIEQVNSDPFIPIYWGKAQSGMQAREELDAEHQECAEIEWLDARDAAVVRATNLVNIGAHKQIANRLLEPFMWMTSIITATDFNDFYPVRRHEDAQPEMRRLADLMFEAQEASRPNLIKYGDVLAWHLPFIQENDVLAWMTKDITLVDLCKVSAARCARVSYLNHQGTRDLHKDISLCDALIKDKHWSPLEHIASPVTYRVANLEGWYSFRHLTATAQKRLNQA